MAKCVDVLDAVQCVNLARKSVTSETTQNSFSKAGFKFFLAFDDELNDIADEKLRH